MRAGARNWEFKLSTAAVGLLLRIRRYCWLSGWDCQSQMLVFIIYRKASADMHLSHLAADSRYRLVIIIL